MIQSLRGKCLPYLLTVQYLTCLPRPNSLTHPRAQPIAGTSTPSQSTQSKLPTYPILLRLVHHLPLFTTTRQPRLIAASRLPSGLFDSLETPLATTKRQHLSFNVAIFLRYPPPLYPSVVVVRQSTRRCAYFPAVVSTVLYTRSSLRRPCQPFLTCAS